MYFQNWKHYPFLPLTSKVTWCPSCDIILIPFYCLFREWLLSKTEVRLSSTNTCLITVMLSDSLMLNSWLFISGFVHLSFVLTIYVEFPFMIFRFDPTIFTFVLDLACSFSIFNFSPWIFADYFFSRNPASVKSSAILSFPLAFWWSARGRN